MQSKYAMERNKKKMTMNDEGNIFKASNCATMTIFVSNRFGCFQPY